MTYLLKGGRIIDPSQGIDRIADLLVIDELIDSVEPKSIPKDAEIIDVSEKIVIPGLVDMHVHSREPGEEYKETIETASKAAVAGGFTTIVTMANTKPPIDTADRITFIYKRGSEALSNIYPVGAVTRGLEGRELAEFADMVEAGAVAFSDDGRPIENSELMRNALAYSSQLEIPILVHEEDTILSEQGQIHEGEVSSISGMKGIPTQAETSMIARDLGLLKISGGKLHIQHVSAAESIDLIRDAKTNGLPVTCEVTPHHLLLNEMIILKSSFHSKYKMMPPLRGEEDREALVEGLIDGAVDAIATDHAPQAVFEKDNPFDISLPGVIGLETAFPLIWTKFIKEEILTPLRAIELMSTAPAKILDLPAGSLDSGSFADVTVIDPNHLWTVDPSKFFSKSRNTPFDGWELTCKVVMTIVKGKIVFNELSS